MVFGFINSGIFIDLITLILSPFLKSKKKFKPRKFNLSIIIPAYNEEQNITKVIDNAYNQTQVPKQVIVIDDNSTDNTVKVCKELKKKYKKLNIIENKVNRGKSNNINYVLNNFKLSELTMVLDADTFLSNNFIEEITKPFVNERIVIATGKSFPIEQENLFGKLIYNGSIVQYKFFAFRKIAQSMRNAVSVISGDSSVYRTSFLKNVGGLPSGTQTEDIDITWLALEQGHKVYFQKKALARSKDAATFKGHWKQITRWFSGAFQNTFKHGRDLNKAKSLLYTTIVPFYLDSFIYASLLLFLWMLYFQIPSLVIGFYVLDFILTVLAVLIVDWKKIIHLPEIYFVKILWSFAWLYSLFNTTFEYLGGQREWGGTWSRDNFYAKKKK